MVWARPRPTGDKAKVVKRTVFHDMCIFVIDTEFSLTGTVVFCKYTKHITITYHKILFKVFCIYPVRVYKSKK